jgi:phosphoenolpyruvate carboxylase
MSHDFNTASKQGFDSLDWQEIYRASALELTQAIKNLPDAEHLESFAGLTGAEVKKLYFEKKIMSRDPGNHLIDVRDNLRDLSVEQLSAIMQIEAVQGFLWTGAHVMAERNQQNLSHGAVTFDRTARRETHVKDILTMKKVGYTAEDLKDIYAHKIAWLTFTAHPTKDKSKEGQALYSEQARIADTLAPGERKEAMNDLIGRMLRTQITPRMKDTYEVETQDGLDAQSVYNKGVVDYFQDLQWALDEVYGPGAIDLLADDMHMDVASRKWHGGDADGKPVPATVLFNQRVEDAIGALSLYLDYLQPAKTSKVEGHEKLAEPIEILEKIREKLLDLSARGKEIREAGSTSDLFYKAQEEFTSVFTGISYEGSHYNSGPKLTHALFRDIHALADDEKAAPHVRTAAWNTTFLHKQSGMAMGRTELRHNARDYNRIFDNLYRYLKKEHPGVIKEQVETLSDLPELGQLALLKRLMDSHEDKMGKWLVAANKDGWSREILERFRMVRKCYNNGRMGTSIIAEADATSAVKQQFLAESFGIQNMVHVALNEDLKTIKNAAENLAKYTKRFGRRNIEARRMNGGNTFYCVMDPQSDSQKSYGVFIKAQQRKTKENLISLALDLRQPVYDKIGTGASYARGGFSPKIIPRLFTHVLTNHPEWENFNNEDRRIVRKMACFDSTTIQGRDIGLRVGSREQAYDLIAGIDKETNAACAVVDRKVAPEVVAPVPVKYSPAMEAALDQICNEMCDEYYNIVRNLTRTEEGRLHEKRKDGYVEATSALRVSKYANVGARPDSRAGKELITEARAIGCNIAVDNTETKFDGWHKLGSFMDRLYKKYHGGKITKNDLADFKRDEFFMHQIFPNAFSALASADMEWGFDKLNARGTTVGALQKIRGDRYNRMDPDTAFHAVLANNAIRATSFMEALLEDDGFDQSYEQIIGRVYQPEDKVNRLKFGPKTREMYPDIDQLQRHAPEKRLSSAVIHEVEERIRLSTSDPYHPQALNPDDPQVKSFLHHVATAHRNQGPINMNNLLDQPGTAFGRGPEPVMKRVHDYIHGASDPAPARELEYEQA